METEAIQRMKEQDSKLKRNIRRFSVVVIGLLAANFAVFTRTQEHQISDDGELESAWGDTKAWPAAILLTVASVSAFLSILVLLSYLKSVKWANRLAAVNATIMITASVVALGIWAISAGLFHKQDTGFNVPNIWSWACNHKASSDSSVNFNQICITQNWSFICAIIEIILEILTIGSFLLIFVRMKSKREMRKSMSVSMLSPNEQESFVKHDDADLNTPTRAYADLEGQKRTHSGEKENDEKKREEEEKE